jgi:alpha-glucosidase
MVRFRDRALDLRRARAAIRLMLPLPGSAYVYQGEELGLPDVVDLPDEVCQDPAYFRGAGQDGFRDGCRVPIPWTRTGSSYGTASRLAFVVHSRGACRRFRETEGP